MRNNKARNILVASLFLMGFVAYSSLAHATSQYPEDTVETITAAEADPSAPHQNFEEKEVEAGSMSPMSDTSKSARGSKSSRSAHQKK